jgi:hypothetical protein
MMLNLTKKKQIEERRNQIAADYKKAKSDFAKGKLKSFSATEFKKQLGKY